VVVVGRDRAKGEAAAAQLAPNGRYLFADLARVADIDAMLRALPSGPVQCVFANAGVGYKAPRDARTDDGAVDRVLMTNFVGPFVVVQRLLPRLQHAQLRTAGRAIFTVGPQLDYAVLPPANLSAALSSEDRYAASKVSVYCTASEFARRFPEIRVVLFVPPPLRTDFHPPWMPADAFPGSLRTTAEAWADVALGPPRRASPLVWRVSVGAAAAVAAELEIVKRAGGLCFAQDVVVKPELQSELFACVFSFAPEPVDGGASGGGGAPPAGTDDSDSDHVHVSHPDRSNENGSTGNSARKRGSESKSGGGCVVA